MAEELKFLAWSRGGENEKQLMDSLAAFHVKYPGLKVSANIPDPAQMWPEIVRTALYGFDTDLAQVGSTYIESLKGMNALRPFSEKEVLSFGGESAFVKAIFEAGRDRQNQLWGIPWSTDARVIFYRRDLLAKAGINEEHAFDTPAQMEQTLQALQDSNMEEMPLALGTTSPQALTTFSACWVWGAGGDYINADGTAVTFHSAEAQQGFCNYFNLGRYLKPAARKLDITTSDQLFCKGQAAVAYAGTWLMDQMDPAHYPMVSENLGVALPPGVPMVGGTHLIIWKRSLKDYQTLELIRFLTTKETSIQYPKSVNIPARLDALNDPVFSQTAVYRTFNEAIQIGRSVSGLPLWALVEDRMGKTLQQMWAQIDNDPEINIEKLVADTMNALARRLSATLS